MDANGTHIRRWTIKQALLLAIACLVAGIAGGWSIRAVQGTASNGTARSAAVSAPAAQSANATPQMPNPVQLKQMADTESAPLLAQLKSDPDNPALLTAIGNVYYDAQQYRTAIDYYTRSLKLKPAEASVRTDMGTAYWYTGDADRAIAEFRKALEYAPNNANTLFNLGLVQWRAKKDAAGALAEWNKLLAANPDYKGRGEVERMLLEVKTQQTAAR
jgi:tetratricopeptide (TPR) repeat protein